MSKTVVVFQKDCILAAGGREGRFPNLSWVKRIPVSQENSFHKWQRALEVIFSFLAIFQVLQGAFLIFHVF